MAVPSAPRLHFLGSGLGSRAGRDTRARAETSPDVTQNKLGTALHKGLWDIFAVFKREVGPTGSTGQPLCPSKRLVQYSHVPAGTCCLGSGHSAGHERKRTRVVQSCSGAPASLFPVMNQAQAPALALISGPVTCRALGRYRAGQTHRHNVLTLHGYCRAEGEERLKKLSERGKKEKQY